MYRAGQSVTGHLSSHVQGSHSQPVTDSANLQGGFGPTSTPHHSYAPSTPSFSPGFPAGEDPSVRIEQLMGMLTSTQQCLMSQQALTVKCEHEFKELRQEFTEFKNQPHHVNNEESTSRSKAVKLPKELCVSKI